MSPRSQQQVPLITSISVILGGIGTFLTIVFTAGVIVTKVNIIEAGVKDLRALRVEDSDRIAHIERDVSAIKSSIERDEKTIQNHEQRVQSLEKFNSQVRR